MKKVVNQTKLFGFRHLASTAPERAVVPALQAKVGTPKGRTLRPVGYHAVTSKIGLGKD